jgi:hypothetical protein
MTWSLGKGFGQLPACLRMEEWSFVFEEIARGKIACV